MLEIRVLESSEASVLDDVSPDVFDEAVDPNWTREFFADPRHHLAVAIDDGMVVGMASGVHYVHPDKPPELWINEVGVADSHQKQGIGKRLLAALLDHSKRLGCTHAWVQPSRFECSSSAASNRVPIPCFWCESATPTSLIQSSGGLSGWT